MPIDLAVGDLVKQLRRAGTRPSERLAQNILRAGPAAVGPLLALAIDTDLLEEEAPECYAPLHALRLLGELRPLEMIQPLLREFPLDSPFPDDELIRLWQIEVPQMIGRIGAAAVEPLWAIADDESWSIEARGVALEALSYITLVDPSLYDTIVAGLRERLASEGDKSFNGYVVAALANLGVPEVYKDVMALYREGRIDQEVIPAGAARQLLLTKSDQRLACVQHPLWERYDHHGPIEQAREA